MTFAISGRGVVSHLGLTPNDFSAGLSGSPVGARGPVPNISAGALLGPKGTQFMDRATALAVYAARSALDEAGWTADNPDRNEMGLVLGTSNGSLASIASMTRDTYVQVPPYHVSAMEFPNTVMNSPAGNCAIWLKLKGLNATISSGHLSSLNALQYAIEKIQLGYAKSLLVGGVEEYCDYAATWLAHARALRSSEPIALAEGSIFFVVEHADVARAGGRPIFAEILGCTTGFDAELAAGRSSPTLAHDACNLLRKAELSANAVSAVVITGLGHPATDACEAIVLNTIFGCERPLVLSPTSELGDTGSALNFFQVMAGLAAVPDQPDGAVVLVVAAEPSGHVGAVLLKQPADRVEMKQ
jgi:3-oxoacyl-[acyl-carrier-protein] synthase II